MNREIPDNLIIKNLAGESTPEEDNLLWKWVDEEPKHLEIFNDAVALYSSEHGFVSRHEIESRLGKTNLYTVRPMPMSYRIAAALLLIGLFSAAIFLLEDTIEERTEFGEVKKIILPDQSRIWLNGGTTIKYKKSTFLTRRKISVQGEVYVEVANGNSPFVIEYDSIEASLDSGEVNIQTYPHELEKIAVVNQGLVKFSDLRNISRQITASVDHEIISRSDYGLLSRSINTNINFKAWVTGIYVFHDEPIERVISVMVNNNSKFNIKIDDIYRDRLISGVFQLDSLTNSQEDILHHIVTQRIFWK
jgi:transmembrane sensor